MKIGIRHPDLKLQEIYRGNRFGESNDAFGFRYVELKLPAKVARMLTVAYPARP